MSDTVLLFDLGGVLVENDMFSELKRLSGSHESPEALLERWLRNPLAREFELGRCTPDEFARAIVDDLDLAVSPEAFLQAFAAWPRDFSPGVERLLAELGNRYRTACLSNSNAVHWGERFTRPFHDAFSSHLIGRIKPDRDAFEHVLQALDVEAGEVHFFDDAVSNVEAARALGLNAHHTPGFARLQAQLERLGFHPGPR